jgi:hypothetical protein
MQEAEKSEPRGIKKVLFNMSAEQILLLLIAVMGIIIYFAVKRLISYSASTNSPYLLLLALVPVIGLSGGSIMNRNGIEVVFLLLFGITIIFGPKTGFIMVIAANAFSLYLGSKATPVDFAIEKNTMILFINTLHNVIGVAVLWFVINQFGLEYIYSNILFVYMVVFVIQRSIRMFMLATYAQLPPEKVLITNSFNFVINFKLGQLFALRVLEWLATYV